MIMEISKKRKITR